MKLMLILSFHYNKMLRNDAQQPFKVRVVKRTKTIKQAVRLKVSFSFL